MNHVLRPCAHCGNVSPALVRTINRERYVDAPPSWHVECRDCGMRTDDFTEDCHNGCEYNEVTHAMDDAIECCVNVWNNRSNSAHVSNNTTNDNTVHDDETHNDETPDYFGMKKFMYMVDDLCDIAKRMKNNIK